MPGIPSHILIAEQAIQTFSPTSDSEVYAIVNQHPNLVRLGSVGPDLAFFAPDFGDWSVALVRILAEFYDDAIKPIVELYEDWVEPVLDTLNQIEDNVEVVLDAVTCDLVSTLSDNVDAVATRVSGVLQGIALNVVADAVNIFDHMTPPIQKGKTESDWFWFDTLHNRRTGRFITEMWQRADTDEKKAYVLGYSCHFAGDFIGHQFVNTVVGSPARARLQRHHFAENIIDTHLYDRLRATEVTGSKVHLGLPHGSDVESANSLLVLLDNPNEVPGDMQPIFEMFADAMRAAFEDTPHPQRIASEYLTVENLNTAFWLLLVAMRASTSSHIPPPSYPGDQVLGAINDAMADFLASASNPPAPSFSAPDFCANFWSENCDFSVAKVQEWLETVVDSAAYLGELLVWAGDLIRDLTRVFACALTAPVKLAIHGAFWLIHEALHALLTNLREGLVMAALISPEAGWAESNPIAQSLLNVSSVHKDDAKARRYPHRAAESNAGFHAYPTTQPEQPTTVPSGFMAGTTPEGFVQEFQVAEELLKKFAEAADPASSRQVAIDSASQPLGSVVPFEVILMRALVNDDLSVFSDWSLDSDRGCGYLNWRMNPGTENAVAWDSSDGVQHDWSE